MRKTTKKFKVREAWLLKGWTYVEALTKKEAKAKLEAGEGKFVANQEEYPFDTDWESLKKEK